MTELERLVAQFDKPHELMLIIADFCEDMGTDESRSEAAGWRWLVKFNRMPKLTDGEQRHSWIFVDKFYEERQCLPDVLIGGPVIVRDGLTLHQVYNECRAGKRPYSDMDNNPKGRRAGRKYMKQTQGPAGECLRRAAVGIGRALRDGVMPY